MSNAIGFIETKGLTASIEAADVMLKTTNVTLVGKEKLSGDFVTIIVSGDLEQVRKAVQYGAAAALRIGELVAAHVIVNPHKDLNAILPLMVNKAESIKITEGKILRITPTESTFPVFDAITSLAEIPGVTDNETSAIKKDNTAETVKPTSIIRKEKVSNNKKRRLKKPEFSTGTQLKKVRFVHEKEVEEITTDQNAKIESEESEIIDTTQLNEPVIEKGKKKNKLKVKGSSNLSLFDNVYGNDTISRLRRQALGLEITAVNSEKEEINGSFGLEEKPGRRKVDKTLKADRSESIEDLSTLNVHQLRRAARNVREFPIKGRQISKANRDTLLSFFKELKIE